jgi:hypothetical protein
LLTEDSYALDLRLGSKYRALRFSSDSKRLIVSTERWQVVVEDLADKMCIRRYAFSKADGHSLDDIHLLAASPTDELCDFVDGQQRLSYAGLKPPVI